MDGVKANVSFKNCAVSVIPSLCLNQQISLPRNKTTRMFWRCAGTNLSYERQSETITTGSVDREPSPEWIIERLVVTLVTQRSMHHGYTRHRSPDTLFSMAGAQVKRIVKDSVRRFKPPPSNSWYPRYFTCSEPSAITRLAVRTLHEYLTSAPHVFKVENALKRSFRLHFIVYTSMFSLFTCSSLVLFPGNSSLYFESIKKVSLMRKELFIS